MTDWYAPNQQAVRADGSGPAEEGTGGSGSPPESPAGSEPLDDMTKDELVDYAETNGIEVSAGWTKAEIRAAIDAA